MSKLVTLEQWAQRRYEKPPSMRTLYRWAQDAKILPRPKKEGRAYFVQEHAQYVDWNNPDYEQIAAALNEQASQ